MAIKIIKDSTKQVNVSNDLIIRTIETNRDRVRTSANMILSLSGIVLSASMAFLLFIIEKKVADWLTILSFGFASLCFLVAAYNSIHSSFLRKTFTISEEAQFITDLLYLLNQEISLLKRATFSILTGMLVLSIGVVIFIINNWN